MDTKLNIASCKETNTEQVHADEQTKSGYAAKENEPEGTV